MKRPFHSDRPDVGDLSIPEDVSKEVRFHLDMRVEELIEEGWEPAAAREEARRLFGHVEKVTGEMGGIARGRDRAVYRARFLDGLTQDLKYSWRTLKSTPTFTLVAVLTLALGIGANTAIFSVVNGVLLRPLPYPDAHRLVRVMERNERSPRMRVAWPNYVDWKAQARSFEVMTAYTSESLTVLGPERAIRGRGARVSQGFFDVLRVSPMLGRTFVPEEHRTGAAPAAVVSHRFWQDELGGEPDVSGHQISAGSFTFQVVGVMPPGFAFPDQTDVWTPAELQTYGSESRTAHNYSVIGRLGEGVPLSAALAELDAITVRITAGEAGDFAATGTRMEELQANMTRGIRRPLVLLLGAALLVLLVACSNLASTFLARAHNRDREMAVRASLGAARSRIVRQLFTEAVLVTGIGALAGLLVAAMVVKGLLAIAPDSVPRLEAVHIDAPVLAFTLGASAVTVFLFGLLPGLQVTRRDVGAALRGGSRGNAGHMRQGSWRFLVASEVALALILLVGSGLLIRSFGRILEIETGFNGEQVVAMTLELPELRYAGDAEIAAYYEQIGSTLAATPGIADLGIISSVPLAGSFPNGQVGVDEGVNPAAVGVYQIASAGYFTALEIPLLKGRLFDDGDDSSVTDVVVVSESFAELAWPGQDPIGKRMNGGGMDSYRNPEWREGMPYHLWNRWATVVGVVADVRQRSLTGATEPTYYFHYKQRPARSRRGAIVVKTGLPAASMIANLRTISREMDAMVPATFRLMDDVLADSVADRRFTLLVLGAFAGLALLLSSLGIYGVVSYFVACRTREMGIRMALGAEPGGVRKLVQRGAMSTVVLGLLVGIVGALMVTRLMESLLYGVSPSDPATLAGVVALLLGAAWLASYFPAKRTSRIDPILTMKAE